MDKSELTDEAKKYLRNRDARVRRELKRFKENATPEKLQYLVDAGKYSLILSSNFIERNNAFENLELLKSLYKRKFKLYERMEKSFKKETLRELAERVRQNEFKIQKAFNFEPSDNFFRFWEMPKCNCPHMDNQERFGCGVGYIYRGDCPIHGAE